MIIAHEISKSFDNKRILDNISFHIKHGETLVILGLNGSGKTTLLKILAGILDIDEGYIRVNRKERNLKHKNETVGFVSYGKTNLSGSGTIREAYEVCKKMYHISEEYYTYVLEYAAKPVGILDLWDKNSGELSLGEKSRVEFVYTLLIRPQLWLLDEPTVGVDYDTRMKMYHIISHFKKIKHLKDVSIVIATHNMQEMEALGERVMVLNEGKIAFIGSIEKMKSKYRTLGIICFDIVKGTLSIQDMPINKYTIEGNHVEIIFDKVYISAEGILKQLFEGAEIKNISINDMDLESMIKNIF